MIPSRYPADKPAIIMAGSGRTIAFGELEALSNQVAHLLRRHGLKRGDSVALCMENHPLFLPICWGAARAGLYFTAISYRLQPAEVEYIVNDCGARVLFTTHLLQETFEGFRENLVNHPSCYMLDGEVTGASALEPLLAELPHTPINDESYGMSLLYSSGTTGRPKGVKKPLIDEPFGESIPAFEAARLRYQFDEATVYLSPAPLYHAAPLGFNMNVLRFGGTTVVMEHFDAERSLDLIGQFRATHSQWVPTMFVRMLKLAPEVREKYDTSSMQIAIHAAAPCPIEVKEQMIKWWGEVIYEYYAGTEGNGSTAISSREWLDHKGSVGRAANNCRLHILDEDGKELEPGETGGVYFEGGGAFEYLGDEEKTLSSRTREGWSTLGDIGYVDAEGYLYLTDRKSFMIISGGVNIYPQEAENALIMHPAVTDVAVFGVPNDDFGEEVKAVVQLKDPAAAGPGMAAELISFAKSRLSAIKCPRSVDFIEEMPRHPTGKLYKRLLKDQYWPKT